MCYKNGELQVCLTIGGSTDDDLDDLDRGVPSASAASGAGAVGGSGASGSGSGTARYPRRSILKSRRSEESLSPLSDAAAGLVQPTSGSNSVGFTTPPPPATPPAAADDDETGSPVVGVIRPILKRDKSGSPTRGSTSTRSTSPLE